MQPTEACDIGAQSVRVDRGWVRAEAWTAGVWSTTARQPRDSVPSWGSGLQKSNGDESSPKFQSGSTQPINRLEENIMIATYTFDVFSSLDGFGSLASREVVGIRGGHPGWKSP